MRIPLCDAAPMRKDLRIIELRYRGSTDQGKTALPVAVEHITGELEKGNFVLHSLE